MFFFRNFVILVLASFLLLSSTFAISSSSSDFLSTTCTVDVNDCDTNSVFDLNIGNNKDANISFYFFYSQGCEHCKNVEEHLAQLSGKYKFNAVSLDVKASQKNTLLFKNILEDFNISDFGVPVVVINNNLYSGDKDIIANLENELKEAEKKGEAFLYVPKDKSESPVGFWSVTALAFADSINPCELVVLLILLSAILLKYDRKKVLEYGLAFIITIFIIYFFIGVLAIFGLKMIGSFVGTNIFYWIFGILAIVLGALNLKDALAYGAGGFIMEVPRAWRPTMKNLLQSIDSIWSAVIIAVIIAVFLLPCTAGPYFLASGILYSLPWSTILLWLVYYNIIFILPMLIILFVVYFGFAKIETLQRTRDKNIKNLHLIASILLILLGLYLLWLVIF